MSVQGTGTTPLPTSNTGTPPEEQRFEAKYKDKLQGTSLFTAYKAAVGTNRGGLSEESIFKQFDTSGGENGGADGSLDEKEMAAALKFMIEQNRGKEETNGKGNAEDRFKGASRQGTHNNDSALVDSFLSLSSNRDIGYDWSSRYGNHESQQAEREAQIKNGQRDVRQATRVILDSLDNSEIDKLQAAAAEATKKEEPTTTPAPETHPEETPTPTPEPETPTAPETETPEPVSNERLSEIRTEAVNKVKDALDNYEDGLGAGPEYAVMDAICDNYPKGPERDQAIIAVMQDAARGMGTNETALLGAIKCIDSPEALDRINKKLECNGKTVEDYIDSETSGGEKRELLTHINEISGTTAKEKFDRIYNMDFEDFAKRMADSDWVNTLTPEQKAAAIRRCRDYYTANPRNIDNTWDGGTPLPSLQRLIESIRSKNELDAVNQTLQENWCPNWTDGVEQIIGQINHDIYQPRFETHIERLKNREAERRSRYDD